MVSKGEEMTAFHVELTEEEEMFLERLWCLKEVGKSNRCAIAGTHDSALHDRLLASFLEKGLVTLEGETVNLTENGFARAQDVIRRRRLAEVLLHNVLDLNLSVVETNACKIEHIISNEVTDSICTFLGHPVQCPHGKPIPPGNCCREQKERVRPLIEPLKNVPIGKKVRVVFITSPDVGVIQRLTSLGLHPGVVVNVRQHTPTVILRVGETDIALDPAFAGRIYCRFVEGRAEKRKEE